MLSTRGVRTVSERTICHTIVPPDESVAVAVLQLSSDDFLRILHRYVHISV